MIFRYFFELSGESLDMPAAEAARCIESESGGTVDSIGPGYIIASFDDEHLDAIAERIALTHSIGRYLGAYDPSLVDDVAKLVLPDGTFAIRAKRFKGMMKDVDSQKLIITIGGLLSKNNDVDLKEPDVVVRMQMCDKVHLYIEEKVIDGGSFDKRKVSERPFFSPISLHPKYARTLINLTGAKRGSTILDPFCGTGGIVIEAAHMGMNVIASDFDEEMIIGCRENMEFYGLELKDYAILDIADIADRFGEVDAIVTDPPYGRSTKTGGENASAIHVRALESMSSAITSEGRVGLILPYEITSKTMRLENVYKQHVHGSLSRHYHIFKKI